MRRFLTWYLPLAAGLVLSAVFGWGFIKGLLGDAGEIVRESAPIAGVAEETSTIDEKTLVVILGDSLARGTGDEIGEGIGGRLSSILDERGVTHEIANLAINGAETTDLLEQLGRENVDRLLGEAEAIVVSIGGNDFFGERDSFGVAENVPTDPSAVIDPIQMRIGEIIHSIREENDDARIFLLGLYNPFMVSPAGANLSPLVARWNADLLARFASDPGVVIVQTSDLFLASDRLSADRFHPNGEAYGMMARRIADAL